jgi:hypothetical protein
MGTTARVLLTLVAIGIGVILAPRAFAEGTEGDCIAGCNEECNLLVGGALRLNCKIACRAGRCGQYGALQLAAATEEPGLNCEFDEVCNEFCAEGPVPDTPDCDPEPAVCPCNYAEAILKTDDIWQCSDGGEPNPPQPLFGCATNESRLTGYSTFVPAEGCVFDPRPTVQLGVAVADLGCELGPSCHAQDDYRDVWVVACATPAQAQACADDVGSYAVALDEVDGVTVNFTTTPEACPPLAP